MRTAGRAAYAELSEAGVRLFEFQPTMLHAKTMAVDGRWATVGTMNFDNRSFQLHDEVTLAVWDEGFASRIGESFAADLERSEEIGPERWDGRSPRHRLAEGVSRLFRREL